MCSWVSHHQHVAEGEEQGQPRQRLLRQADRADEALRRDGIAHDDVGSAGSPLYVQEHKLVVSCLQECRGVSLCGLRNHHQRGAEGDE